MNKRGGYIAPSFPLSVGLCLLRIAVMCLFNIVSQQIKRERLEVDLACPLPGSCLLQLF
jgi:hypothetical protein